MPNRSAFWSGSPSTTFDSWAKKRIAQLAGMQAGAHIHIIGICGTGTGSLLQLLVAKGFHVTGSDKAFYPPMGDLVRHYAARVYEGYSEASFEKRPDCVVIGNTAAISNPEVRYVLEHDVPFCSMDEALSAFLIGDHQQCPTSIVVAGTHGKTTTTALLAWIFEVANRHPAYFVGGVTENFSQTIRGQSEDTEVASRVAVLEGDEYNSAFFARYSKFHAYRADVLIITSLEFDHGDLFPSIEAIEEQFHALVAAMPVGGAVFVASGYPALDRLAAQWKEAGYCSGAIYRYGCAAESTIQIRSRDALESGGQRIEMSIDGSTLSLESTLSGAHNAENILAATAVALRAGVSIDAVQEALKSFSGVKRRQQLIYQDESVSVVEDFAHHPTAVEKTLAALAERYKGRRLVVAFDPRSNTSRRHFFQQRYVESFDAADLVLLKKSDPPGSYSLTGEVIALDTEKLVADINQRGVKALLCEDAKEIESCILEKRQDGDCVVLMSNGSFDGLPQSLAAALKAG